MMWFKDGLLNIWIGLWECVCGVCNLYVIFYKIYIF